MDQTLLHTTPDSEEECRVQFLALMEEIERVDQRMRTDREEIIRLRAEADVLKRQTRRILTSMGLEI
jgi:hypothetical protein